jgi:hypothetical protein
MTSRTRSFRSIGTDFSSQQHPFKIANASMFEATRNLSRQQVREVIEEANDPCPKLAALAR